MSEEIKTFDEKKGVGIASGKPPSETKAGPRRRAPTYYAGEHRAGRPMLHPDVERYPNGAVAGVRNKFARRLIRNAFGRHFSKVEKGLKLPRAMQEQARLIAKEQRKSSRWARRLFERELAIHDPVYAPNQKELRAMRTAKRKLKRQGKQDAISALVDKMAGPR
jgi:hypothetical protein